MTNCRYCVNFEECEFSKCEKSECFECKYYEEIENCANCKRMLSCEPATIPTRCNAYESENPIDTKQKARERIDLYGKLRENVII